jgi:hypothetical protein
MGAKNAIRTVVSDYAPDPNGGALFHALTDAIAAGVNNVRAVAPRAATWNGWTRQLQQPHGAAGVANLGAARVYAPKSSELNDQREPGNATAGAIFAARMGRSAP